MLLRWRLGDRGGGGGGGWLRILTVASVLLALHLQTAEARGKGLRMSRVRELLKTPKHFPKKTY